MNKKYLQSLLFCLATLQVAVVWGNQHGVGNSAAAVEHSIVTTLGTCSYCQKSLSTRPIKTKEEFNWRLLALGRDGALSSLSFISHCSCQGIICWDCLQGTAQCPDCQITLVPWPVDESSLRQRQNALIIEQERDYTEEALTQAMLLLTAIGGVSIATVSYGLWYLYRWSAA
ncbi:hypothetical protein M1466_01535 [Candidatus Dependentiae bacterium]|nr:hypothetical protein [Candidatus Dependentiae bacterium]